VLQLRVRTTVVRDKLKQLLDRFRQIETAAADGGLPFADAMRLVAGVAVEEESGDPQLVRRVYP
jgi:hypothetical protein